MEIIFLSTPFCPLYHHMLQYFPSHFALYLTSWWRSGNIIHLIVSTCIAAGVRGNTLSGSGNALLIYNTNAHHIQKKHPVFIINAVAEGHIRNATCGSKGGYGFFIFWERRSFLISGLSGLHFQQTLFSLLKSSPFLPWPRLMSVHTHVHSEAMGHTALPLAGLTTHTMCFL